MKITNLPYQALKSKAWKFSIIAAITCFALAPPVYAAKIRITETANQQNVEMKTGDNLEIILAGNPTTGYTWENVGGDNIIISPRGGYEYIPDELSLAGSGGKFIFSFQGTAAGKTNLRFIYHRTFEKGITPLKSFEILIIVQ